jgi:hypothetical protein
VSVHFTTALAADSPVAHHHPGRGRDLGAQRPDTWPSTPPATLAPGISVTVTVPGGSVGRRRDRAGNASTSRSETFSTSPMSTLRVQQLLAELGYLPVSFTPADPAPVPAERDGRGPAGHLLVALEHACRAFMALWAPGQNNVVTQGAIMTFESQHGLPTDGDAGPRSGMRCSWRPPPTRPTPTATTTSSRSRHAPRAGGGVA